MPNSSYSYKKFKLFSCDFCNKTYTEEIILKQHTKYIHLVTDYQCKQCDFISMSDKNLQILEETYHNWILGKYIDLRLRKKRQFHDCMFKNSFKVP